MHFKWILIGLFVFGAASNAGNVKESAAQQQEIRQEQAAFSTDLRDSKNAAREAKRKSELALLRVSVDFTPVYDRQTGRMMPFTEGYPVTMDNGWSLSDGEFVANELGDTGEIQGGKITNIASASTEDKAEFNEHTTRYAP
jgi:hypothetical protein